MQYQVQFLDGLDNVLRELKTGAGSVGTAFLRGASIAWPPDAIRVRVLDRHGRATDSKLLRQRHQAWLRAEGRKENDRIRGF
jgi:hypothetical protein